MILSNHIKATAKELGFAACGISRVGDAESEALFLDEWLRSGCHAGMKYMENYRDLRLNPAGLVEGAKSIISVALNYYPEKKLPPEAPHIAYYAYGKDYHIVVKDLLQQLWNHIAAPFSATDANFSPLERGQGVCYHPAQPTPAARFFTDSAPILERYWAWRSGLGWIGRNTNLIIPGKGSYFFLGEIVTTLEVDGYDTPQPNRCGTCRRCLDACPTGALERANRLNATKCLSYLTIENRGEIPEREASLLAGRLYGCDTCQEVCPWNRFATPTAVEAFHPSPALFTLRKEDLKDFSREDYNRIFGASAVKRAKYEGLIRTINSLKD